MAVSTDFLLLTSPISFCDLVNFYRSADKGASRQMHQWGFRDICISWIHKIQLHGSGLEGSMKMRTFLPRCFLHGFSHVRCHGQCQSKSSVSAVLEKIVMTSIILECAV